MSTVTEGRTLGAPFGTWPARLYLAASAVLIVWLAVVASQPQDDANFAAVIPFLFTAPTSLVALAVPDISMAGLYVVLVVSTLANAWVIDIVARRFSGRRG
ncbi:SCO4225 family membrane protein [Streptomyces sp. NBC_00878]|uniref:SCO4225 family membrane protein n=1 Tax=Streptomyces sp. NBC_00878 TaxID=2975854 RepID=UPI002254E8B6|nr:hypothetical protein [Streptomyces sp. NBC_00878]MCX4911368.1 hypothetical protein [Streptomyces sp. NBC_00878]